MKRKEGYMLRTIGNSYLIVPVSGKTIRFDEMLSLNETGAYLWKQLEREMTSEELLEAVLSEYEVDAETAAA